MRLKAGRGSRNHWLFPIARNEGNTKNFPDFSPFDFPRAGVESEL